MSNTASYVVITHPIFTAGFSWIYTTSQHVTEETLVRRLNPTHTLQATKEYMYVRPTFSNTLKDNIHIVIDVLRLSTK